MAITIPSPQPDGSLMMHATAVAIDGRGVLICGPSGSGKSSLALQLMALGADLIADDATILRADLRGLHLSAHANIAGRIEAAGVGILNAATVQNIPCALCIDLGTSESARLPQRRSVRLLDQDVPMLHSVANGVFAAAVMQYMKAGRSTP